LGIKNGIFTISLDFELYWGLRDKRTIQEYEGNLKGVPGAIDKILALFEEYEVHATWATVGFLFAKNFRELSDYMPNKEPCYLNDKLSPYLYMQKLKNFEDGYHCAPLLIDKISNSKNQEVASHTFSHYYCLERGQSLSEFEFDINSAVKIAESKGIDIKSLVFPRNQYNEQYLSVLKKHSITSYRGNEESWLYKSLSGDGGVVRRALRLLDAYVNLSGKNCYNIDLLGLKLPNNIPSSRFLRPVSKRFSLLENLRRKRITNALTYAAKNNKVYHLWWHPHNFGLNTEANINFLESILVCYSELNKKYGMTSLNMNEVSQLIQRDRKV